MDDSTFRTPDGDRVTAVTTDEMRDVDRVAVEGIGLDLVRMMEHAGRGLARTVIHVRGVDGGVDDHAGEKPVTVVAGNGGNGGGGLACARHLANRGIDVRVVLDRDGSEVDGVTATQLGILTAMDVPVSVDVRPSPHGEPESDDDPGPGGVVVDALVGYGLRDAPRGRVRTLIDRINDAPARTVSLDVPSGVDATTGERPGVAVDPAVTATLALPKTGLAAAGGDLRLIDLSIPATVYDRLDIGYEHPFGTGFSVPLERARDAGE